jgi:hypothetical protein
MGSATYCFVCFIVWSQTHKPQENLRNKKPNFLLALQSLSLFLLLLLLLLSVSFHPHFNLMQVGLWIFSGGGSQLTIIIIQPQFAESIFLLFLAVSISCHVKYYQAASKCWFVKHNLRVFHISSLLFSIK